MRYVVISMFIAALVSGCGSHPTEELSRDESIATAGEVAFIRSVIQRITEEELREYIQALESVGTRYAPSAGNLEAARYIQERFSSFGLTDVYLDELDYYNTATGLYDRTRNVVATKTGSRRPEKIVILAAHFDTVTRRADDGKTSFQDADNPSPGADDNGSGVAAVLAAARALSDIELDTTVRFVTFSAEEGGIHGSAHYAAECARKSEDIEAVVNLDMIGYIDQEPEDIDIFANEASELLLDEMVNNAGVYTPDLLVYRIVDGTFDGSDHGPFWNNGYPAICLMEDYYPSNPHYHTPADTADTIDFSFALRCTRLAVATLAELAGIQDPDAGVFLVDETTSPVLDWKRDSGRRFLFTMSPSSGYADVIDISVPGIHARRRITLDTVPEETWATPRFYPVDATVSPTTGLVLVTLIRMRTPGDEIGGGILRVIDPVTVEMAREVPLGRFPAAGSFNAEATRYYQPYWGEEHIDVFATGSFERLNEIPCPLPVLKLRIDDKGELGVGVSPDSDSVLIFNLTERKLEKRMSGIKTPRDLVLVEGGRYAVVSGYDPSKLFLIDVMQKEIVDSVDCAPRPRHLIPAPEGNRFLSVHEGGGRVGVFRVVDEQGAPRLEEDGPLDLGEEVVNASFADDADLVYFISSGRQRLFGMDLTRGEIVWGMRTGDVRARSDVEHILFVEIP